jgi:protein tyrosine/serine phosphatase
VNPNIPNLFQFDQTRWRGGEPVDADAWKYLRDNLGIKRVIQLDPRSEGSGAIARLLGLDVRYHPVSLMQQILVGPNDPDFRLAIRELYESPVPVFMHCLHGNDRTGLGVGCYRIWYGKWGKSVSRAEMDKFKFHAALIGLTMYWMRQPDYYSALL